MAVERFRRKGWRWAIRSLIPARIDQLLYLGQDKEATAPCQSAAAAFPVTRYDLASPSGLAGIDNRLTQWAACYAVRVSGRVVHESWLRHDVLLPSMAGYSRHVPVIGDCFTDPDYRGRGIYPYVLRYIAQDVCSRGVSDRVFVLVSPGNRSSIRGIERAGFRRIAGLSGWRLLGYSFVRERG